MLRISVESTLGSKGGILGRDLNDTSGRVAAKQCPLGAFKFDTVHIV